MKKSFSNKAINKNRSTTSIRAIKEVTKSVSIRTCRMNPCSNEVVEIHSISENTLSSKMQLKKKEIDLISKNIYHMYQSEIDDIERFKSIALEFNL
jgi:hypothetical protein